jgi:hypothetical protein
MTLIVRIYEQEKAQKASVSTLIKSIKKQLPFLERVSSLTEFDLAPVKSAFEEMDTALLNPTAKISLVRVRSGQKDEGEILENGAFCLSWSGS